LLAVGGLVRRRLAARVFCDFVLVDVYGGRGRFLPVHSSWDIRIRPLHDVSVCPLGNARFRPLRDVSISPLGDVSNIFMPGVMRHVARG
jgi:hypothetical protein